MRILVTGARGFVGRNLLSRLRVREGVDVKTFDRGGSELVLKSHLASSDVVCHLAGVNREDGEHHFQTGNIELTRRICSILQELGRASHIVFASSIQATLDNSYGVSKRQAEDVLEAYRRQTGAPVTILRLKNVFGKWSRPNYNSVVATFCHNIANELPIYISDPLHEIELVYIDDVVTCLVNQLCGEGKEPECAMPSVRLSLSELAGLIQSFRDWRENLMAPDFAVRFNQQLYATYLSYVPPATREQRLRAKSDDRGSLAEFVKSKHSGQIFVSRTRKGIVRGNHYHHTKTEKFLVVEGEGLIRIRPVDESAISEYRVCGDNFQVIDIPPGCTHSIENVGRGDMVTLFWASEIFNPDEPDTFYLPVLDGIKSAAP